ncbi:MAG: hypothetical protein IJG62_00030, partial [Synergistaceae bacterium]|nr:hypothetical protein [Synergistaceae bacterium]
MNAEAERASIVFINFRSRRVRLSRPLVRALHLDLNFINKNFEIELEHWQELCHPEDHEALIKLGNIINNKELNFISLERRLYCGDGVYRKFCLDAFINRNELTGRADFLLGAETCVNADLNLNNNIQVMSAVQALKLIELLEHSYKFSELDEIKSLKINLLNLDFNNINNNKIIIGAAGLEGSGRTSFIENFKFNFNFKLIKLDLKNLDLLRACDLVFYLVPVRGILKYEDKFLLDEILKCGVKIICLMTQIEVERAETQAGEVICSRLDKLKINLDYLNKNLNLPVIPVSSKLKLNFEFLKNIFELDVKALRIAKAFKLVERALNLANNIELKPSKIFSLGHGHMRSQLDEDAKILSAARETLSGSFNALKNFDINLNNFKNFELDNLNLSESNNKNSLVASLVASMQEEKLRGKFAEIINNKHAIILGEDYNDALKLVSRLEHNAALIYNQNNFNANNFKIINKEFEILLAPSDEFIYNQEFLKFINNNWRMCFAKYTPVINLDLVRLESSLSGLERMPYFKALINTRHFIISSSSGGFFDDRLSDLFNKVLVKLEIFMSEHRFKGRAGFFIYENYDSRYTDFINFALRLNKRSSHIDILNLIN